MGGRELGWGGKRRVGWRTSPSFQREKRKPLRDQSGYSGKKSRGNAWWRKWRVGSDGGSTNGEASEARGQNEGGWSASPKLQSCTRGSAQRRTCARGAIVMCDCAALISPPNFYKITRSCAPTNADHPPARPNPATHARIATAANAAHQVHTAQCSEALCHVWVAHETRAPEAFESFANGRHERHGAIHATTLPFSPANLLQMDGNEVRCMLCNKLLHLTDPLRECCAHFVKDASHILGE